MERPESVEMVKRQLPTLSDEDAEYLVSAFSDHPLLIRHVCGLFLNQSASIIDFCRELRRDAQRFAAQVKPEDQSILLAILRRMVKFVTLRDRTAFALLDFISFYR